MAVIKGEGGVLPNSTIIELLHRSVFNSCSVGTSEKAETISG